MTEVSSFIITTESCSIGFNSHITLDPLSPIETQMGRQKLVSRAGREKGNVNDLRAIIERNASLRVAFGWSFESGGQYEQMMEECLKEIVPRYNMYLGSMISDLRGSWLGFAPFNAFEKHEYEHLGIYGLIIFNNELIDFQTEVVRFISKHKCFLQHSLLRNADYRYKYFKAIRNNPGELFEAFHYYLDAINDTISMTAIPRQIIEEQIGCHYLGHPEVFYELLEFYKLKGVIYE